MMLAFRWAITSGVEASMPPFSMPVQSASLSSAQVPSRPRMAFRRSSEAASAAGQGGVMTAEAKTRFGVLHGISAVLYLVKSLFGAVLIFKNR